MTTKHTGGPAFPTQGFEVDLDHETKGYCMPSTGMSLLDYFAAKAMQGMLAHDTRYRPRQQDKLLHWHDAMSKEAYEIADAMLKAREEFGGLRR